MAGRIVKEMELDESEIKPLEEDKEIKGDKDTIDSELEFLKYMGTVKHRLNKEITDDFTLAVLEDQDKKGVIEMTVNAYYLQRVIEIASKKTREWRWNNKEQQWEQTLISPEHEKEMKLLARAAFDTYMTKVLMTVVMNRNKADNHLVRLLIKRDKTEENDSNQLAEALTKYTEKQKTANKEEDK